MSEEPPSPDIRIALLFEDARWRDLLPDAEEVATRAARTALDVVRERTGPSPRLAPREAELNLVLADDVQLRALNRQYRGLDKPTNVLSFGDLDDFEPAAGDSMPHLLGDVVLARETIAAEAQAQGKSLADHLSHLVVHGVLHLLGYDHRESAQAAVMERLEARILGRIGIADPYDGEAAALATSEAALPT